MKDSQSDSQLIAQVLNDDDLKAYTTLFERYQIRIYTKCVIFTKTRSRAEDLTHDIFFQAFLKLSSLGDRPFYRWLYQLMYKSCVNYARKRSLFKSHSNGNSNWKQISGDSVKVFHDEIENLLLQIKSEQLLKILRMLSPSECLLLLMIYQDQLSKDDICHIMRLDRKKVEMNLLQARKKAVLLHKQHFPSDTAS